MCNTEQQVEKAKKMTSLRRVKIFEAVRLREQRGRELGGGGGIPGVPFTVSIKELSTFNGML